MELIKIFEMLTIELERDGMRTLAGKTGIPRRKLKSMYRNRRAVIRDILRLHTYLHSAQWPGFGHPGFPEYLEG